MSRTVRTPKPLSEGEELFAMQCQAYKIDVLREYQFCEERKWRFDFVLAIPGEMIAIEIEGGIWSGGRHTRAKGYEADLHKYNSATRLGWRVYRYTTAMVEAGTAINDLLAMISIDNI